ncbi:exodeoxyribonuclease VII large subunit [Alicycliphilus denitrificans]|uniref:exodeoxyribonuclease VII large subunit n=1 Tax=Alicycliphilus denitrificans TaxID=179636 RepID=UPI00384C2FF8
MFEREGAAPAAHIWEVGALCRAIADALQARFNPVAVRGEISGFSRASSGHCYFTLKDGQGQIRCAMFRRAAGQLDFMPRDGELVEVQGQLGVYEARGDLQLIVEGMRRAGQGALFEQFLLLKARLEAEGLFDGARKRPLPAMPRGIGLVTSPGAAALHDVVTALRRRVPHIPVVLVPALVQGAPAPASICDALSKLYLLAQGRQASDGDLASKTVAAPPIDVILLVRGGGSIEDLWAFNDERVARTIVQSPVPLVSGVGHETDFSIADFCADLRAPTPTAAAELVSEPRAVWLGALELLAGRLQDGVQRQIDLRHQRLDQAAQRLGRPSGLVARQQLRLAQLAQRMRHGMLLKTQHVAQTHQALQANLPHIVQRSLMQRGERLERAALRLELLNPQRVLERGYALLTDAQGQPVMRPSQVRHGDAVHARLAEGELDLAVTQRRLL